MGKVLNNGVDVSTYLNGTKVNNGQADILGVNLIKGITALSPKAVASGTTVQIKNNGSEMEIVNVQTGAFKKTVSIDNAKQDRTASDPSGYDTLGVSTYGSGRISRNTVWATDDEVAN